MQLLLSFSNKSLKINASYLETSCFGLVVVSAFSLAVLGGVVVSTVISQQGGSWFKSQLGPFCLELAWSHHACKGSFWVLWLTLTVPKACISGQMMIIVSFVSVWHWQPVQGVPRLFPNGSWDRFQSPYASKLDSTCLKKSWTERAEHLTSSSESEGRNTVFRWLGAY